ncbi:hypothetical protein L1049_026096 [Liquidambar formosana]|uniref:Uncharacterized protein n=1 Tax=Liquidambar formosana TaxID=63359 RepID=A0AAP0NEV0_LIQFO
MESTDGTSVVQRFHSSFSLAEQHNQFDSPIFSSSRDDAPMRQSFQNFTRESNNKPGVPPSHPPFPQTTALPSGSQQLGNQNSNPGPSHSRSLSQPTFFALDCLPPLSPLPHREASSTTPPTEPILIDLSMEERNVSGNTFGVNESHRPRKGHRRSNSDIPLGFSEMIQSSLQLIPIGSQGISDKLDFGSKNSAADKPIQLVKREADWNRDGNNNAEGLGERESEGEVVDDLFTTYMDLDKIDTLNSSGMEDKDMDSRASGTKTNGGDSSDNEVESNIYGITNSMHGTRLSFPIEKREGVKRSAGGDIAPTARHYRSVSMDSFMGNLHFDAESLKLPSLCGKSGGSALT